MARYLIEFSTSYEVHADTPDEAMELAQVEFDIDTLEAMAHNGHLGFIDCHVVESFTEEDEEQ